MFDWSLSRTRSLLPTQYGGSGSIQFLKQLVATPFITVWNLFSTTLFSSHHTIFHTLRMSDQLETGDDAVNGTLG
jgi:hypothetical protein